MELALSPVATYFVPVGVRERPFPVFEAVLEPAAVVAAVFIVYKALANEPGLKAALVCVLAVEEQALCRLPFLESADEDQLPREVLARAVLDSVLEAAHESVPVRPMFDYVACRLPHFPAFGEHSWPLQECKGAGPYRLQVGNPALVQSPVTDDAAVLQRCEIKELADEDNTPNIHASYYAAVLLETLDHEAPALVGIPGEWQRKQLQQGLDGRGDRRHGHTCLELLHL